MRNRDYPTHLQLVKPENEAAFAHVLRLRQLDKFADFLLRYNGGHVGEAESMLDDIVDLLTDGGVLSTWRYRILLNNIKRAANEYRNA